MTAHCKIEGHIGIGRMCESFNQSDETCMFADHCPDKVEDKATIGDILEVAIAGLMEEAEVASSLANNLVIQANVLRVELELLTRETDDGE